MKKILPAILIAASFSCAAQADEPRASLFFGLGKADQEIVGVSKSDTSIALGGTYKFNTNFEAEIRYDDFGSADFAPGVEASLTALGLGIKGIIPLNDQFNLYAKFGFASWDVEGKVDGEKGSESGSDIYYGFGAQFFANDNVALSVEYSMLTAEADGNIDYDVTNIGVSLGYYF